MNKSQNYALKSLMYRVRHQASDRLKIINGKNIGHKIHPILQGRMANNRIRGYAESPVF